MVKKVVSFDVNQRDRFSAIKPGETGQIEGSLIVDENLTVGGSTVSDLLDAVDNLTALRALTGTSGQVIYLKAHTTAGDGGNGEFRWVSGAAPGTYVDNNGTIIVPTGGDGSAAWLRDYSGAVNVRWFNEGSDRASITAALSVSKNIFIPKGTYDLGATSSSESIIDIDGGGGSVSISSDGIPEFTCTSASGSIGNIFNIRNAVGVSICSMKAEDAGFSYSPRTGVALVQLTADDGEPVKNVQIGSLYTHACETPLRIAGVSTTRVSNVSVDALYADESYYGFNAVQNGDNVTINALYTYSCQRSFFVYGVQQVKANVFSRASKAGSADILIAVYGTSLFNTENIEVNFHSRDTLNASSLMLINAFDENSKVIRNIKLNLDIVSTQTGNILQVAAYTAGGVLNTGATNNVFDNIRLDGHVVANSSGTWYEMLSDPTTKGYFDISDALYRLAPNKLSGNIKEWFFLWGGGSFTPTIIGTTSAGAGTYSVQKGRYSTIGGRVFFEIELAWSAHTGVGNIYVGGLPFTAANQAVAGAPISVVYSGLTIGAGKQLGASVNSGAPVYINLYAMDPSGGGVGLVPIDATGTLYISGHYEFK